MSTLLGLKSLLAHKTPKEFAAGEERALLASAIFTTTQNGTHFCLQWPCQNALCHIYLRQFSQSVTHRNDHIHKFDVPTKVVTLEVYILGVP